MGASWKTNQANTIELYGLGAPQKHGQKLYERNIGTYDAEYALSLDGYDAAALDTYYERGYAYNETWNYVDPSYEGLQADHHGIGPRKLDTIINERENFYDKPQVRLNWYLRPENSQWSWDNIFYYSGGEGGGSGTYGSVARVSDPGGYFHRNRDWNAEIAQNSNNPDGTGENASTGILRNSRNNQWTIGAISKVTYESSENWSTSFGLDWRTAEIQHFREVRDLLGGDHTVFDLHANWSLPIKGDIEYELFANVLNVFDENYIHEATDADFEESGDYADLHDADGAAVHFGVPRRINAGIKIAF